MIQITVSKEPIPHDTMNALKTFIQSVALVLGILLGALPALAAIPCTASDCAMEHCACCCGPMGEMSMEAPAVTISAPVLVLPHAPLQPAAPACNCSATDTTASATVRVEEPSGQTAQLAIAAIVPDLKPPVPQDHSALPLAEVRPPAQSLLCTFLI